MTVGALCRPCVTAGAGSLPCTTEGSNVPPWLKLHCGSGAGASGRVSEAVLCQDGCGMVAAVADMPHATPHHAIMRNGCQPRLTQATNDGGVSRPTLRLPWYQEVNQAACHKHATAIHSTPCSLTAPHAASQHPMQPHSAPGTGMCHADPLRGPFSMGRAQALCLQHVLAAAGMAAGCVPCVPCDEGVFRMGGTGALCL